MILTKVIDNELYSSGKVKAKVRVRSPIPSEAKNRAIRRAILYNGFAPSIKRSNDVTINVIDAYQDKGIGISDLWIVDVEIEGMF